jgi:phosphatidate cytidylyltransferase
VVNAQLPVLAPRLAAHAPYIDVLIIACYALCAVAPVFREGPSREMCGAYLTSLGIYLYIAWMLSFLGKLFFANIGFPVTHFGRNLFLFIIAVTKMADVGAYVVGTLTAKMPGGNHKLAPRLSPKKSVEGLVGGTVFSVGTAIGLAYIPGFVCCQKTLGSFSLVERFFNIYELIAIGVLASVVGLLGDLIESALKRAAALKDSGHIPGIGGILDVLDSLIPISPLFYAYVLIKVCN